MRDLIANEYLHGKVERLQALISMGETADLGGLVTNRVPLAEARAYHLLD